MLQRGKALPSLSNLTRCQFRLVFHIKVLYVRKWRNLWNCFGWFWQRCNYNSDRKGKLVILILLFLAMLNSKNPRFLCFCCVIEIESLFKVSQYILLIVWHFVVLEHFIFFINFVVLIFFYSTQNISNSASLTPIWRLFALKKSTIPTIIT